MPPADIAKQQFKNMDAGWVGAVVIGPRGDDRGVAVEPGQTVWLSEAEQRLTANAPRRAEDNPFVEQTRQRVNEETGDVEDYTVTPLVPVSEERWVPADARLVPGIVKTGHGSSAIASEAAKAEEPTVPVSMDANALTREHEVQSQIEDGEEPQPRPRPQPPHRAVAAAEAAQPSRVTVTTADLPGDEPDGTPAYTTAPPQPGEEDPFARPAIERVQSAELPGASPQQQAENEAKVAAQPTPPVEEEQAARVNPAIGEETGAAPQATGEPPQGEYAQSEEVGTPVTPEREEQPQATQQQPPPYSPGSTE